MTQPANNATPAASAQPDGHLGELAAAAAIALLLAHADEAEALEYRAGAAATAQLRISARTLMVWSTRTWVERYGSLDARIDAGQWADLRPHVVRQVRAAVPDSPAPVVLAHAREALQLGARQAAVALNIPTPPVAVLAPETVKLAKATEAAVTDRYATVEKLLAAPVESHAELVTALAPTQGAVSDVDRDARTVVNTAVNQGAQDVAEAHGADLLWFAERSACVVCQALHGTVVAHGEDFPVSATFGKKPTEWWTPPGSEGLLRPPRHPRCRCRVEPYLGHNGPGMSLPEALKREAQRSILKGWSVPSESEQVRVDAAERLLARGSALPKTVQAAAREAVRRRKFVSRNVPQHSGR